MRLTDLNPAWALIKEGGGRVGVTFDCPGHPERRLHIFFANPPDGCVPYGEANRHWRVEGDTFSTLTLSPSIDVFDSNPVTNERVATLWHGWVRNGEIVNP